MSEVSYNISGICDPSFEQVKKVFIENFNVRDELGASVCVYKDNKKVVDLWGGYLESSKNSAWTQNTITLMNSVAKSICSLAVLVLYDRGIVDIKLPVAEYWPEFKQNGKSEITVHDVLGHKCGAVFSDNAKPGDWFNYPEQCKAIAEQEPAWPRQTRGAYNTINIGFILGEVVRNVTGKTIGNFIREEISTPLGAEYNIGLNQSEAKLVASMHLNPENKFWDECEAGGSNLNRAHSGRPTDPDRQALLNCDEIRLGELPAFGGHGNARGVAKIYAMLANNGEIDGVRLLKPETVEEISKLQWRGVCEMTHWPTRMALGFEANSPDHLPMGKNMSAFGKLGSGGAIGFCDRENKLAFSYCTNYQCEGAGVGIRCKSLIEAAAGKAPSWDVPKSVEFVS